jgi:hypothetical protein
VRLAFGAAQPAFDVIASLVDEQVDPLPRSGSGE